jgi:hypothetical protein
MHRRWQKDAASRLRSLEPLQAFAARLKPLSGEPLSTCDAADLYAVLSALHSKGRNPELRTNALPAFYYFLADAAQPSTSPEQAAATQAGPGGADQGCGAGGAPGSARREPVVPVSSKHTCLTPELIMRFFQLEEHPNTSHILLAIVDDDGSVSLLRVFNYIQPPFEGPEALPPEDGVAPGDGSDEG